ncbi:MAG: VCBS repeat-containing protein [Cyclobacteriaceae bacterium]|nr:VCBS repeat-containing protein [Cyclobacteriaceae bacterium]MCK5278324.1 VCBS repeat-containing protein [Cyclobacteriaceae bacterium]MCK5367447.1 VCBS repeat-containing protein [Cyclobacteriaceae bacterium]MCK5470981.1 VCBS repeat-containing protein [Cyclobacteriaceae bacterium]
MIRNRNHKKKSRKRFSNLFIVIVILMLIVGIPFLFLNYQAQKSGMSISEVIQRKMIRSSDSDTRSGELLTEELVGEKISFLTPESIGQKFTDPPMISHIIVEDLDNDGLMDVVVCDAKDNFISWIRQFPVNVYTEKILAKDLIAPAHVQAFDFDNDGDKDLMVAVLGLLYPSNDKIGSVVILENDGQYHFKDHVVVEKIARVSDVRAGDLDGDGDMDLAVAQFGYDDGETRWIENLGNWDFKTHMLQNLSGPINVEIVDIDDDNDLDIISLVSQEWEEIYCYLNDGNGDFQMKLLWGSDNEDFGSSGIYMYDLNQDGRLDILYANGDAFDYIPPQGKPWHGLQWFENKGNLNFEYHRICTLIGAYSLRPSDIDQDGDIDLFAVSAFNLWEEPTSQSFIWMENIGDTQFMKRDITNAPTHLIILEPGDFNKDGLTDFVTGGMYPYPPFDRMSRVTLWINDGTLQSDKE